MNIRGRRLKYAVCLRAIPQTHEQRWTQNCALWQILCASTPLYRAILTWERNRTHECLTMTLQFFSRQSIVRLRGASGICRGTTPCSNESVKSF